MIFSLKLYESSLPMEPNWRLWGKLGFFHELERQTSSDHATLSKDFVLCHLWTKRKVTTNGQALELGSFFRSCDVLKGLCSLSFVNEAEGHYEWTGLGVGVVFTPENFRAGENKKSEPEAWGNRRLANQNVSHFLLISSSHFTWPCRFRSSEKQIASGSGE